MRRRRLMLIRRRIARRNALIRQKQARARAIAL
jgi:hypothetical protein